jgi:hypothetical protein
MSHGDGHFPVSGTKIAGFGYTKVKRLLWSVLHGLVYALPSTAAHLTYLPGSSCISAGVLTSFVPPVRNQGVSLAPLQGLALWKKFLPTTGSFFVIHLTDLIINGSLAGTFVDVLPVLIPYAFSYSCYS